MAPRQAAASRDASASDVELAAPAVARALVEAGADILGIGESRHSLEDVYLEVDKAAPLRKRGFTAGIGDLNTIGGDVEQLECARTTLRAPARWQSCGAGLTADETYNPYAGSDFMYILAAPLDVTANQHHGYRVQVKATDDLGRSTVASAVYDPVPCVAQLARRPRSIGQLLASGLAVRASCDASRRATLLLYTSANNGHRYFRPRDIVSADDGALLPVATLNLGGQGLSFTAGGRMKIARSARSYVGRWRSLGLVLVTGTSEDVLDYPHTDSFKTSRCGGDRAARGPITRPDRARNANPR